MNLNYHNFINNSTELGVTQFSFTVTSEFMQFEYNTIVLVLVRQLSCHLSTGLLDLS